MGTIKNIDDFLKDLKSRLELAMPKIRKEVKLYEEKMLKGKLTKNPSSSPQFNE